MSKKVLSVIFILFIFINSAFCIEINYTGNNTLVLHNHEIYKLFWDESTKNPAVVWYTLSNWQAIESDAVDNRANDFRSCSQGSSDKKDYVGAKLNGKQIDKGHMACSGDFDYSKETSSLTFYMCNMCPQTHSLNAGQWLKYEKRERKLAKDKTQVTVVCGPIYTSDKPIYISSNKVKIPDAFFKVFIYNDIIEVYYFTQNNTVRVSSLDEIKNLTNLEISK